MTRLRLAMYQRISPGDSFTSVTKLDQAGDHIDNNVVDAIGIFKSELQSDFLQFEEKESNLEMILQHGINLSKLDKGCLIFNYKKRKATKS